MSLRSAIKTLVVLALGLPIVHIVLAWTESLVANMGDERGAVLVGRVAGACQITWAISLAALVIVVALTTLDEQPNDD